MPETRPLIAPNSEMLILGQALQFPDALHQATGALKSEMFTAPERVALFEVAVEAVSTGSGLDPISASERLRARGVEGAVDLIADLVDIAPSGGNAGWHIRHLRELYILRSVKQAAEQTVADIVEPGDAGAPEILASTESRLLALGALLSARSALPMAEAAHSALERARERQRRGVLPGLSTGFQNLDRMTGGLGSGELILIAGRPSMGKTSLALSFARNAGERSDKSVLFLSLEMSQEELSDRLLAMEAQVDLSRVRLGSTSPEEMAALTLASQRLRDVPLIIDDAPGETILAVRSKARRLAQRYGAGLIVLDYIQLMTGADRSENRVQQVAEISRGLKLLARELSVPVVALSQLSRAVESRSDHRPLLSDLRDSGSLEQDADIVLFPFRPEYYLDAVKAAEKGLVGAVELIVAKQRNGPVGRVPLYFDERCTRMESFKDLQHTRSA